MGIWRGGSRGARGNRNGGTGYERRVVLPVAVVAGAAILAPSAFAHLSGLTVTGTCNPATGKYDLTWTVGPTTDTGLAPFIAASNRTAIPVNTLLPTTPTNASIKDFTQSVSLASGAPSRRRSRSDGTTDTGRPGDIVHRPGAVWTGDGLVEAVEGVVGWARGIHGAVHDRLQLRPPVTRVPSRSRPASSKTISGIPIGTVGTVNESLPDTSGRLHIRDADIRRHLGHPESRDRHDHLERGDGGGDDRQHVDT